MIRGFVFFLTFTFVVGGVAQESKVIVDANMKECEVLLIGSSHWNNYNHRGSDIVQAKQIDILSEKYQRQLEDIVARIADFNPDKIFVERTIEYQPKLDSLYHLYRNTNWGNDKRNEIFQLGFRVADRLDHQMVYGIDNHDTAFPYDTMLVAMRDAGQQNKIEQFSKEIKNLERKYNQLVEQGATLDEIFDYLNSAESRRNNFGWYLNEANKTGKLENTIGSILASEWIRRNLHMYSYIQKYVEASDDKIMILLGAGHAAVLANFIQYNPSWKIVELSDI